MDEWAGDRVHPGREFGGRHHPPMAFLVVAKVLPAMQERAAEVEPLGVEGGLDLPPLRLPDQPLGRDAGQRLCLSGISGVDRERVADRIRLSPSIQVRWLEDGEHSFKPRASSGRTQEQNWQEAIALVAEFVPAVTPT